MTEEEYIAQGDAAWKAQDWKLCHDSYVQVLRINPESQAAEKRDMVMKIISFFNKDMLNP